MSSYQFVNSLAQCYGQQARSAATDQSAHQASTPGADYYNPNAAAASSYPPACYSPPQVAPQYPQHPYATPAPGHGLQPTMGDYTQLQPQRMGSNATSHMHHASPGAASPGMLNPSASCKYADSTSSTGVASPQDLSTSGAPTRGTPPLATTQVNSSSSVTITKTSGLTSPLSVSTSPAGKQTTTPSTASQNLSSPASSTSSTSSTEKSASNNNNSSKSGQTPNPPQIYPWMKRVHLGQSK